MYRNFLQAFITTFILQKVGQIQINFDSNRPRKRKKQEFENAGEKR